MCRHQYGTCRERILPWDCGSCPLLLFLLQESLRGTVKRDIHRYGQKRYATHIKKNTQGLVCIAVSYPPFFLFLNHTLQIILEATQRSDEKGEWQKVAKVPRFWKLY